MARETELDASTRRANEAARRRLAIIVLVAISVLFVVQLVALMTGLLEISFAIFAVIVIGWFALRSYQKRHPV